MKKLILFISLSLLITFSYGQKSVSIGGGYFPDNANLYLDHRMGRVNHTGMMYKYHHEDMFNYYYAISFYYLIPYNDDMSLGFSVPVGLGFEGYETYGFIKNEGNVKVYFHVGLIKYFYLTSKLGLEIRTDFTTTDYNKFTYSIGLRF